MKLTASMKRNLLRVLAVEENRYRATKWYSGLHYGQAEALQRRGLVETRMNWRGGGVTGSADICLTDEGRKIAKEIATKYGVVGPPPRDLDLS